MILTDAQVVALKRLRGRIYEERVRQSELARRVGFHPAWFSRLINGHERLPDDFIARVAAEVDRLVEAERAAQRARDESLARSKAAAGDGGKA